MSWGWRCWPPLGRGMSSDTSTTPELLEAVRPDLALISAGLNNKYGHPSWDTLYRLDQAGAKIYRTDLYGTIELLVKEK